MTPDPERQRVYAINNLFISLPVGFKCEAPGSSSAFRCQGVNLHQGLDLLYGVHQVAEWKRYLTNLPARMATTLEISEENEIIYWAYCLALICI